MDNIKFGLSEHAEKNTFLGLDTYTKNNNLPSAVLGGGVQGKFCWLIAYVVCRTIEPDMSRSDMFFDHNIN